MSQAFEAYKKYLAIKSHFTQPTYDYFKYGGRVKANFTSFDKRKDKYFFYKLSKQKDVERFLISSFVDLDHNIWIGDLLEKMNADNVYTAWLKRQETLSYTFRNDLDMLDDDFNANFTVKDGQHPRLLVLYLQHKVCIETLIILNVLAKYTDYWNSKIEDHVLWPTIYQKMIKYQPFIKIDVNKCKLIAQEHFITTKKEEGVITNDGATRPP